MSGDAVNLKKADLRAMTLHVFVYPFRLVLCTIFASPQPLPLFICCFFINFRCHHLADEPLTNPPRRPAPRRPTSLFLQKHTHTALHMYSCRNGREAEKGRWQKLNQRSQLSAAVNRADRLSLAGWPELASAGQKKNASKHRCHSRRRGSKGTKHFG